MLSPVPGAEKILNKWRLSWWRSLLPRPEATWRGDGTCLGPSQIPKVSPGSWPGFGSLPEAASVPWTLALRFYPGNGACLKPSLVLTPTSFLSGEYSFTSSWLRRELCSSHNLQTMWLHFTSLCLIETTLLRTFSCILQNLAVRKKMDTYPELKLGNKAWLAPKT